METISVSKFPQIQGSLELARKVALDQLAYENKARGVKSVKIQTSVGAMKVQSMKDM